MSLQLFHDGGPYHIKTSLLTCSANYWTGFYMIGTYVMKELNISRCFYTTLFPFLFILSFYGVMILKLYTGQWWTWSTKYNYFDSNGIPNHNHLCRKIERKTYASSKTKLSVIGIQKKKSLAHMIWQVWEATKVSKKPASEGRMSRQVYLKNQTITSFLFDSWLHFL